MSGGRIQSDSKGGGIGRSVGGFIDPSLSWDDIRWLRSRTKLPIGIKGVQTVEDAKRVRSRWVALLFEHTMNLNVRTGVRCRTGRGLPFQSRWESARWLPSPFVHLDGAQQILSRGH